MRVIKTPFMLYCKAVKSKKPAITKSSSFSILTVDVCYMYKNVLATLLEQVIKGTPEKELRYEKGIDGCIQLYSGPIFVPKII
jgi:hypothetical protein